MDALTDRSATPTLLGARSPMSLPAACALPRRSRWRRHLDALGLCGPSPDAPPELVARLRHSLDAERRALIDLRAARREVRQALLDARKGGVSYWALATRIVPATGDPELTRIHRLRAAAALRARVSQARRRR
jgi:hypothetical protein